jgi:parallel beta-helix repeat protein
MTTVLVTGMVVVVPQMSTAAVAYTPHEVIRITSDSDLVVGQNGVTGGTGSSSNPFVISGWQIGQINGSSGIEVWNTRAHLKIVDVNISSCNVGILLFNVSSVTVKNTIFYKNIVGLSIQYSDNAKISGCTFRENYFAIIITYSDVSRSGNHYIGNTVDVTEKKHPWEQGPLGTMVCVAIMIPLMIVVTFMIYYRIKSRPKRPPETPI